MDDEKIRRGRKKVRGTRFLWTRRHDRVDEAPIVWNPAQYTFEISGRDGAGYTTTHTVLSYFDQVYDVQLKYPEVRKSSSLLTEAQTLVYSSFAHAFYLYFRCRKITPFIHF
jgi:hypothetical protein